MKKTLLILFASITIALSFFSHTKLDSISQKAQLIDQVNLEEVPPEIRIITSVSGNFRSILANILWTKSMQEYQARRYYGMAQMATWLATLQPRNTDAVAFQAWNMAYNLTARLQDPVERWYWIERAIALLRDKAIPLNPSNAGLYAELAWIYQHKIGDNLDMENRYYKHTMARQMLRLLGDKPNLKIMVNAPFNLKLLAFEIDPKRHYLIAEKISENFTSLPKLAAQFTNDPKETRQKLNAIFSTKESQKITAYLTEISRDKFSREAISFPIKTLLKAELDFKALEDHILRTGQLPNSINSKLKTNNDSDLKLIRSYLRLALRTKILKQRYKLDPEIMHNLNRKYGEFDWRLPETHAIYWASLGLKKSTHDPEDRCRDMILTNLKTSFEKGSLLFYRDPITNIEEITWTINTKLADSVEKAYRTMLKTPGLVQAEKNQIQRAYLNFLGEAAVKLTLFESRQKGLKYFKLLQEKTGNILNSSLDDFVIAAFTSRNNKRDAAETSDAVVTLLVQAHFHAGLNDRDKATRLWQYAQNIYDDYAHKTRVTKARAGLAPWKIIQRQAWQVAQKRYPFLTPQKQ